MFLVNGEPSETIDIRDRGLHYGDGVFETLAVKDGEALSLEAHLVRLTSGMDALGFPVLDMPLLMDEIKQVTSTDPKSVLKIMITRGIGGRGYAPPGEDTLSTRIIAGYPWPDYNSSLYEKGVKLTLCQTRQSRNPRLAGIKHMNRLEQVLARSEWNDPDMFEGIMLDTDGNVIEGTMSNLFMIRNNALFTPALDHCGVHGIVRRQVMDASAEAGLGCHVQQLGLEDLATAEEVFITNSTLGVCHVSEFNGTAYDSSEQSTSIRDLLIRDNRIMAP